MDPGTPEHAAAPETLCGQLLKAASVSADVSVMQSRQITALMGCVAALSRELEERCRLDRVELSGRLVATLQAEMGEDAERDLLLRSLLGQAPEAPAAKAPHGPALRLIPGQKR